VGGEKAKKTWNTDKMIKGESPLQAKAITAD